MSRPALKATSAELLPPIIYLNECGCRARTKPLRRSPNLLLHHSSDGFQRAVLRHTSRLGGPSSPPDMSEETRCCTSRASPDGTSCHPSRDSATRRSMPTRGGVASCSTPTWQHRRHRCRRYRTSRAYNHVSRACDRASRACDRVSRACDRASRACDSAMQAEIEAGCVESDESVVGASVFATIT